jgi:pantothenate kinase
METVTSIDKLAERARALAGPPGAVGRRAIVGITGAPGAGKTTVVERLLAVLRESQPPGIRAESWVAHVPMDGFHLADAQLERLGLRDRKGAPETFDAEGYAALLGRLRDGGSAPVYAPGFERTLEQPIAAALSVEPASRLVLTEGNYLLLQQDPWPRVRDLLSEVWYVDVPDGVRVARLVARHVEFGKSPDEARAWVERSDEANARAVAATRASADVVVELAD